MADAPKKERQWKRFEPRRGDAEKRPGTIRCSCGAEWRLTLAKRMAVIATIAQHRCASLLGPPYHKPTLEIEYDG